MPHTEETYPESWALFETHIRGLDPEGYDQEAARVAFRYLIANEYDLGKEMEAEEYEWDLLYYTYDALKWASSNK